MPYPRVSSSSLVPLFGLLLAGSLALAPVRAVQAADAVSLAQAGQPAWGWKLGLGQEFPGAAGELAVDPAVTHDGRPAIRLAGDFSKGGNYVEAAVPVAGIDPEEVSFWFKGGASDQQTFRVIDAAGQCHQFNLKVAKTDAWQRVVFPIARFFANHNVHEAVARYEAWGGTEQGHWTGPATGITVLIGPQGEAKRNTIWISDLQVYAKPPTVSGTQTIRLDEFDEGEVDWTLNLGTEFPGAQGTVGGVKDLPQPGRTALRLAGDFTKGGVYIDAGKDLPAEVQDTVAVRFLARTTAANGFGVRLIDATGQCHQARGPALPADGQWHEVELLPAKIAGGEHWGGANDGKWHGPAKSVHIVIGPHGEQKTPVIELADIRLEAQVATAVKAASFAQDFEGELSGWALEGAAARDGALGFKGAASLRLTRAKERSETATSATGPSFAVAPGALMVGGALSAELRSPDYSYNGQVLVEWLNAAGVVTERSEVALGYGSVAWQPFRKQVAVPAGSAAARLRVQLNKTDGVFHVDELSAAPVAAAPGKSDRIDRITYASAQLGNILFPDDKRVFTATVEVLKPLPEAQRLVAWHLRDYWGVELTKPATAPLVKGPRSGRGKATYKAEIDLAGLPLEIGRYYELVTAVAQPDGEPFSDNTSFAILPEAASRRHRPEDIPFTSRNWDNRLREYFLFSDRLGIRVCGLWGGFDAATPQKLSMPQIELNEQLGMACLSGLPSGAIEGHQPGYQAYTPEVIAEGTTAMIAQYKARGLRFISLGNEPPPTEERARECVPAYKAAYEAAKKADPSIQVIGTSVGPVEAYFKAGFGPYQDVYDFHDYTDHHSVRGAFTAYKALFAKYGHEKPIVSTEIGLNSQGLTRLAISNVLIKSVTTFFACGGLHVSWFDMMYPDGDGKSVGTNGDAMNVFNCRYASYSPRLDAIAYYNMVNGILVKKCLGEKTWNGDVQGTLFRDGSGDSLLVLWKEKGRQDVFVPLPDVGAVRVIRIDGSAAALDAGKQGLTLGVSEDPLLLLYRSGATSLPASLGTPALALAAPPAGIVKGATVDLVFTLDKTAPEAVTVAVPPGWSAKRSATGTAGGRPTVTWTVGAPEATAAREGRVMVSAGPGSELFIGLPVTGRVAVQVLPSAAGADGTTAGLRLLVKNNGRERQTVDAAFTLVGEFAMTKGAFTVTQPTATRAYFADVASAKVDLGGGEEKVVTVPLAGLDPQTIYRVQGAVTDATGRGALRERLVSGFAGVPRAAKAPTIDGALDETDWARSPVLRIDQERQFAGFGKRAWRGPADLSAEIRVLWDERNLYLAATVRDDVFRNEKVDGDLWSGDGLQFLVDPCRESPEKIGKYDYGVALTAKGPQVWCFGSADSGAPAGAVPAIALAVKPGTAGGDRVYELAIPWARVAPFTPGVGRDLGLSLILNDDDGAGRDSFMGWFSGVHSKEVDMVGDLILLDK